MENLSDHKIYKNIIKNKGHAYFISPHLDDAVYSASNLMMYLIKNDVKVTVINVFTQPSPKPYSLSVRKFLLVCGYDDADKLFETRINEDRKVLNRIGANVINLGFVDALWRRKKTGKFLSIISKFIPEFSYVYPIYRLSIAKGKIAKEDFKITSNIIKEIKKRVKYEKNSIFLCPIAIGNHVDHQIVRDTCQKFVEFSKLIYWSDYPYNKDFLEDKLFIKNNNLNKFKFVFNNKIKSDLINSYESQVKIIFKSKINHNNAIEEYFVPTK